MQARNGWRAGTIVMLAVGVVALYASGRVPTTSAGADRVQAETAPSEPPPPPSPSLTPGPLDPAEPPVSGSDRPAAMDGMGPFGPAEVDQQAEGMNVGTATGSSRATGVVRFVYFVEADEVFDPDAVELIERQAIALQRFWFEEFGGTFYLPAGGVDIVYGTQPARWYDHTPRGDDPRWYRLMNIQAEVLTALGLEADDGVRLVAYPSSRIDGRVGATRYGGAWMDGDDVTCVSGLVTTIPYSLDHPAQCLGTVVHELGHVYGLGHEGDDRDCMQLGFYLHVMGDDRCAFSATGRGRVVADPLNVGWLDATPGERR